MIGSIWAFVWHDKWTEYFFASLDGQGPIAINSAPLIGELKKRLEKFKVPEKVLDENEEGFATGIIFQAIIIRPVLIWHLMQF